MERLSVIAFAIFAAVIMVACAPKNSSGGGESSTKSMAASVNAQNVFLIFTGSNEEGRARNIQLMQSTFGKSSFNFKPIVKESATREQVLQDTCNIVRQLPPGSTLKWYFNSHGSQSGHLMTGGGEVKLTFEEVIKKIASCTTQRIRRAFFYVDTCYSGTSITNTFGVGDSSFEAAFEEAVVVTSSGPNETTLRGYLADAIAESVSYVESQNQSVSIENFLEFLKKNVATSSDGHMTMQYHVFPNKRLLADTMFGLPTLEYYQGGQQQGPYQRPSYALTAQ